MSIVKSSMALIGLTVCISISILPAATAASYDKYFSVSQDTFSPFQVRASDSTDWYLNLLADGEVSGMYLAPPDASSLSSYRIVGTLTPPDGMNILGVQWYPGAFNYSCPPTIHLNEENGVDEYGDVKLVVDEPSFCIGDGSSSGFTASRGQPQRLTSLNGDQIEGLSVVIRMGGAPWATYFFGYGVGVVAVESFDAPLEAPSFLPVTLPPPKAEGTVVEYVNTLDFPNAPGGHFFYTADPAEQAGVDAGGAGHFVRTGRSFASGGFLPVCRFYGSMSPGPNSHFFTAAENECEGLKAMQVTPTPATIQQWNYEGLGFYSVVPVRDTQGQMQCMDGTEPVYRAYNNAYPMIGDVRNPWDSNHRYSTQRADIDEMVSKGWRDEGIVLCAPVVAQ